MGEAAELVVTTTGPGVAHGERALQVDTGAGGPGADQGHGVGDLEAGFVEGPEAFHKTGLAGSEIHLGHAELQAIHGHVTPITIRVKAVRTGVRGPWRRRL